MLLVSTSDVEVQPFIVIAGIAVVQQLLNKQFTALTDARLYNVFASLLKFPLDLKRKPLSSTCKWDTVSFEFLDFQILFWFIKPRSNYSLH